jgi:hypothetical protein
MVSLTQSTCDLATSQLFLQTSVGLVLDFFSLLQQCACTSKISYAARRPSVRSRLARPSYLDSTCAQFQANVFSNNCSSGVRTGLTCFSEEHTLDRQPLGSGAS